MTVRVLVAAATCAVLAGCSSKAERIASGLRKGTQYVASADWDKAGVEARNVLQMDPRNAGAYLIAAQVEDGKDQFRNAFANYSKVVELKPDSVEARLALGRLYLLSGDLDNAGKLIQPVLAADPQNLRAMTLDAALHMRRGEKDAALGEADRVANSGQALKADIALALAGLYFNAQSLDPAAKVLDKALETQPADVRLLEMAAEVAQSRSDDASQLARADVYYERSVAVAPANGALWRRWADMHLRHKDVARAGEILARSAAAAPDDTKRAVTLLQYTAVFGDKAKAEKDYLEAIDKHPKAPELKFALADFYRDQKRADDAVAVLQKVADNGADVPSSTTARARLATLWLEQGKKEQAGAALAELLKANPRDATGLVLRGRMEIADGSLPAAIADLRSAAKDKPGSLEVAELLARAHHLAGEPQLAREVLADAVKFNGKDAGAHLMLAADMARTNEFTAAMSEADAAAKADPSSIAAHQMKAELALQSKDLSVAEAEAREMETRFAGIPTGHLLHGRVLAAQGRVPAALEQFDAAAALAPGNPEPRIAAVGLLTSQRKFAEARTRIDAIAQANPNSALARQMRGELALAMADLPQAQSAFAELVALPGAPASAYKNLAAVMVARGHLDEALAVVDRGEKAWPADVTLAAARAEWLGRAGRTDDAIATYEKILARAPNSEVAANNLAYVLAQSRRDKASLDRALQLANRFASSNQPGYVDTLGLVQYRLGLYDQAVAQLGRAATLAPGNAGVQLHYGMALVKTGDVQQGAAILRKALAVRPALADHDEAQALLARG